MSNANLYIALLLQISNALFTLILREQDRLQGRDVVSVETSRSHRSRRAPSTRLEKTGWTSKNNFLRTVDKDVQPQNFGAGRVPEGRPRIRTSGDKSSVPQRSDRSSPRRSRRNI